MPEVRHEAQAASGATNPAACTDHVQHSWRQITVCDVCLQLAWTAYSDISTWSHRGKGMVKISTRSVIPRAAAMGSSGRRQPSAAFSQLASNQSGTLQ